MVKIYSFIKNEEAILQDWLLYHTHLVGASNVYIIDHSSTDQTPVILEKWRQKGIHVFKSKDPFKMKSSLLSSLMKKSGKDFIIPLDADEFLVLKEGNKLNADKERIRTYLQNLEVGSYRYKLHQVDVIPTKREQADPLINLVEFKTKWYKDWKLYAKTFYHSNYFLSTDQGNHKGQVKGGGKLKITDLTLMHYDVRDYQHFVTKMIKGAKAYGHHSSPKIKGGAGKHYHRRYWAIKEGKGYSQMVKEFGKKGNFKTDVLSQKLKELRS
jgi:glycosyltransferase involved in cell wall biosynthesis